MPRYFFDTIDDGVLTTDSTGVMLADPDAAREFSVEVRDESGTGLFAAELSFRSRRLAREA